MSPESGGGARWPAWVLILWLGVAVAAGLSGRVATLEPPLPQAILLGLTIGLVMLGRTAGFRTWLGRVHVRTGILLHLTRFVGFAFLAYEQQGRLPAAFAIPAGVGDVFVAALALGLLLVPTSPGWIGLARLWNLLGLADILFVVVTAARLAMADPPSMAALLAFPLSLLPTFLVPLIIGSHLWLFGRLRQPSTVASG